MKSRRVVPVSTSQRIVEHMSGTRGFSDADIARVIGERKAFVGLVRQGELPLTLDHLEQMAEAVGSPFGAFLLAAMPPRPAKSAAAATKAAAITQVIRDLDRVAELVEHARLAPRRA